MAKRKSISKKVRFEVFKRDSFTCGYCGNTPPAVVLEVDHIQPVSKNGTNDIDNLIAACFDCNRGKTNTELSEVPPSLLDRKEDIEEKETQLKEYKKLLKRRENRVNKELIELRVIFKEYHGDLTFSDTSSNSIKYQFIPNLTIDELKENLHLACLKFPRDPDRSFRYFCGINWRVIKESYHG